MNGAGFQIQLFAQAPSSPVNWRLLSGNNREAGRGAPACADVELCLLSLARLRAEVDRMRHKIRRVEPNHWMWELQLDGAPVAVAGHRFDRLIRCEQAMSQFLAAFAAAPLRAGLVVSGARRWERAS